MLRFDIKNRGSSWNLKSLGQCWSQFDESRAKFIFSSQNDTKMGSQFYWNDYVLSKLSVLAPLANYSQSPERLPEVIS